MTKALQWKDNDTVESYQEPKQENTVSFIASEKFVLADTPEP